MNFKSFLYFCALALFSLGCGGSSNGDETDKEQEDNSKWLNNSLSTGDAPYTMCYSNERGVLPSTSEISIIAPQNSDVLVLLKKNDIVFRHAYISKQSSYTFSIPDGIYQPFFYYGNGWNPNKEMKSSTCGNLRGGFVSNESFSKDSPQPLYGESLEYTLILQEGGNFSAQSSDPEEAL